MSNNNEKYSLHCNDCLRGQVVKEKVQRLGVQILMSINNNKKRGKGKSEIIGWVSEKGS